MESWKIKKIQRSRAKKQKAFHFFIRLRMDKKWQKIMVAVDRFDPSAIWLLWKPLAGVLACQPYRPRSENLSFLGRSTSKLM